MGAGGARGAQGLCQPSSCAQDTWEPVSLKQDKNKQDKNGSKTG